MKLAKLLKELRVDKPDTFRIADFHPADTRGFDWKTKEAEAQLDDNVEVLGDLQKRLYADGHWAVLIVLQGMDAAGKDGVVAHVMSGINPQGCEVRSFKKPSDEELAHDFLWRTVLRLPERGRIGIFNRSHYEEVLVVRVHSNLLDHQKLPRKLIGKNLWKERFSDIRAFERHLARNGTLVLKFFLHISREEQRKRLLARLDEPDKRWKFSAGDLVERELWDQYMAAYEDMIQETSRPEAPWYVVPADHKSFARIVVSAALVEALQDLDLHYPKVTGAALDGLRKVSAALRDEEKRTPGKRAKKR